MNTKYKFTSPFVIVLFFALTIVTVVLGQKTKPVQKENTIFAWPITTDRISEKITSLFGESRGDHFHNGVDISSMNENVLSIGSGKIVYSRFESDSPYESSFGAGNNVWVAHSNGMISGYFHLEGTRKAQFKNMIDVQKGEALGLSGNTGHSAGSHLHFVLTDKSGKKFIDPLRVLPSIIDPKAPIIGSLVLINNKSYTYINNNDNINVSKAFPFTVIISDPGVKIGQRRGIYKLTTKLNQEPSKTVTFTEIQLKKGEWVNDEGYSFNDLFYEGNYFLGRLNPGPGLNTIYIKAVDFHGNETEKTIRFNVNRI